MRLWGSKRFITYWKDIEINGKPVIIVTSLTTIIDLEGLRRWDALRLDTSEKLTKLIVEERLKTVTGNNKTEYNNELRNGLKFCLHPHTVIIPYAEELIKHMPTHLIMRTQINKLLDYIKSSAVLHQYQREKDEEGNIIANDFDYEYGRFVYMHLRDEQGMALNKDEQALVDTLKEAYCPLSIKELSTRYNRHGKNWIYQHLDTWKTKGLIRETTEWDDRANKDISKIFLSPQFECDGLPFGAVLFRNYSGFIPRPTDRFSGFLGFIAILHVITKKREKLGLITLFDENQYNQQKQQQITEEKWFSPDDDKTTIKPDKTNLSNFIPKEEKEDHIIKRMRSKC